VLEGTIVDDAFFAWIASLDPEDAWDDESKWIKACPNLGVTVKLSSMRQMAAEAKTQPESLNAFKRYSLNMRVDAIDQAIATADWNACTRVPTRFVNDYRILRLLREHSIRRMAKAASALERWTLQLLMTRAPLCCASRRCIQASGGAS
jgi:hypothetical protein